MAFRAATRCSSAADAGEPRGASLPVVEPGRRGPVLPPCLPNRPNPPVHIHYPLAVLPDAQEYSFDVQLQQLMDRKRKLAQDWLAPPAFTAEDYKALVAGTLRAKA